MNKFSKMKTVTKDNDYVYDNYLKILNHNDYEFVVENDCVILIPHLIDYNEILVRKEYIPTYQYKIPNMEYFLTMVSGTVDDNEKLNDTLIRELKEECGIVLNVTYQNMKKIGEYFVCKSNSSKFHIYYIPLSKNDYKHTNITNDGSYIESISKTVRVDVKYLSSLIPSDLITALCFEKLNVILESDSNVLL